jgi:integrase
LYPVRTSTVFENRESDQTLANFAWSNFGLKAAGEDPLSRAHGSPATTSGTGPTWSSGIGIADDTSDADGFKILSFMQAQDKARHHMVRRAKSSAGIDGPLTVKAAVEAYLRALEANGKTAADAHHRAQAHIIPALGNIEVATLPTDLLRKWHTDLAKALPRARTKPGKPQQYREFDGSEEAIRRRKSSANRVLTILKAALNHAFHDGKVASDTAWRKVKPFKSVDAARFRYLSVTEAKRLINACDAEFRPMVQAALQTGCRYGELARLEVHDLNPEAGTLTVRRSKSGKPRHVVLTDEGVAFFRQLAAGRSGGELLLHRTSGEPWKASRQGRPMADACHRGGIRCDRRFPGSGGAMFQRHCRPPRFYLCARSIRPYRQRGNSARINLSKIVYLRNINGLRRRL